MNVDPGISIKDFFETVVPKTFAEQSAAAPIQGMEGTEFIIQFTLTGANQAVYGISVRDGRTMTVTPGGVPAPQIGIELSEENWRDAISGKAEGALDMFMGPKGNSRKMFDLLKGTKGIFILALTKDDGSAFQSKIVFNGAAAPTTTIKMKAADYAQMAAGKFNGPTAFMQGKMKIEGDMGFAMKLGQFMG